MQQTHEDWLDLASRLAQRSKCHKMRFGCVIVDENNYAVGLGHNWSIRPDLCCLRENVPSGTQLERCWALHAEQVALLDALPRRHRLVTAYVAGYHPDGRLWQSECFYCTFCARLLCAAGLQQIVIPGRAGPRLLSIEEAVDHAYGVARGERRAC